MVDCPCVLDKALLRVFPFLPYNFFQVMLPNVVCCTMSVMCRERMRLAAEEQQRKKASRRGLLKSIYRPQ